MCGHLVVEGPDEVDEYVIRWSGRGFEHALVCLSCADLPHPVLADACQECFKAKFEFIGSHSGSRGAPEVQTRSTVMSYEHREIHLAELDADVFDVAPIRLDVRSTWLALLLDGRLARLDFDSGELTVVARLELTQLDGPTRYPHRPDSEWATERYRRGPYFIEVAPDARFAAVVATRGRRGVVVDLATGAVSMRLERSDYHLYASEFPVAFFRDGARTVVAHATEWNRLDLSDAATGELLTPRGPTSYRPPEPVPRHYRDYCHGGLTVSPDGSHLVDDGWVWHPVGSLWCWNLRRWLHENPWESEDGASKRELRAIEYFWDGPKCFLDERTLALWGYGPDADLMVDAAEIVDVTTGERLRAFAGPPRGRFFFERHLVASGAKGTSVWDVATGERLFEDAALQLQAHHPTAHAFASVIGDRVIRESRLVGG